MIKTIASFQIPDLQAVLSGSGITEVNLCRFLSTTIVDADGKPRIGGFSEPPKFIVNNGFYPITPCTVDAGGIITVPDFDVVTTEDALPNNAREVWAIYTTKGERLAILNEDNPFRIPTELAPAWTYQSLWNYNLGDVADLNDTHVTQAQFNAALATILDAAVKSDTVNLGVSRSSKTPLVVGNPVHVETSEAIYTEGVKEVYVSDHNNSLATAVSAISELYADDGIKRILNVTDEIDFFGSLVIPEYITLQRKGRGLINVTNGALSVRRMVDPGNEQFFNVSPGAHVYFDKQITNSPWNIAWYVGAERADAPTEKVDAAIFDLFISALAAGGAKLFAPTKYDTDGGHTLPNGVEFTSIGSHPDAVTGGGFFLGLTAPNHYIFKVPDGARNIHFEDIILDTPAAAGYRAVRLSNEMYTIFFVSFTRVCFRGGEYGVDIDDPTGTGKEIAQLVFNNCYFWGNKVAGLRCKTPNSIINNFAPTWFLPAGAIGFKCDSVGVYNEWGGYAAGAVGIVPYVNDTAVVTSPGGMAKAWIEINGEFDNINIYGGQTEAVAYTVINNVNTGGKIVFRGGIYQGRFLLNQSCWLRIQDADIPVRAIIDAPGAEADIRLESCRALPHASGLVIDISDNQVDFTPQSFDAGDVDISANTIFIPDHGIRTGYMLDFDSSVELPPNLNNYSDFYGIYVDDDHFAVASSYDNALAGTKVDLTAGGSGSHTVTIRKTFFVKRGNSYIGFEESLGEIAIRKNLEVQGRAEFGVLQDLVPPLRWGKRLPNGKWGVGNGATYVDQYRSDDGTGDFIVQPQQPEPYKGIRQIGRFGADKFRRTKKTLIVPAETGPGTGVYEATINPDNSDIHYFTPAQNVTLNCAPLSAAFHEGQILEVRIKTDGTSRNITFGTNFKSRGVLATGATANQMIFVLFEILDDGGVMKAVEFHRSNAVGL